MHITIIVSSLLVIVNILSMNAQFHFPFGEELKKVVQKDTSPKKVFVLGVYASAIHAKWIDNNGKVLIRAIAVASEPCIFWRGDFEEAKDILSRINIPNGYGYLIPADTSFNGPSGRSLDENYLDPLGFTRNDAWLCDLVPHSCQNSSQKSALEREYDIYMKQNILPVYDMPEVPADLASDERIQEIIKELKQSNADTIILLGDQPVKYFLAKFSDKYNKLSDFKKYGKPVNVTIDNKFYTIIALAHPRQVSKLGKSNQKWYDLHQTWMKEKLK